MIKINNKHTSSILTLASGSLIGQMITVISAPLTTRLFSTEELGLYTLILTGTTMLGPVLSLRYDMAIVVEPEEYNAYSIIRLSIILSLIISGMSGIAYGFYYYINGYNLKDTYFIALVVIGINFMSGLLNVIISYNNRYKSYNIMALGYTSRMAIQNIGMVIAGLLKMGVLGIILSQVLGYTISILVQSRYMHKMLRKHKVKKINEYLILAQKYKKQALFSAPAAFLNGLSYSIINFFIQILYGISALGLYSISYRLLGLPMSIISTNISKVFFEKASREYEEKGNFKNSFNDTLRMLVLIAIPLLAILVLFSPTIFAIAFGAAWKESGIFVQILSPMFILRFIAGGLNCSAIIASRQRAEFNIQMALLFSGIFIYICVRLYSLNIYTYLKAINIVYSVIYLIYILTFKNCAKGDNL